MILMPKPGEKVKSKFNEREFIIELVGERMIVLKEKREAIRFVTTIDNLRSFYEYAAG
ncbi:MAG: hypothetical protein GXX82_12210 [Syntrophorhabdus sp.]|nr:hypothetical protein [Syntrophorhabdus sp.]